MSEIEEAAPWDMPRVRSSVPELYSRALQLEAAGDLSSAGRCLTQMGFYVYGVGSPPSFQPGFTLAQLNDKAILLIRKTDDKLGLCRALRARSQPFYNPPPYDDFLTEALAISREIDDKVEEGWILFRMTRVHGVPGHTVQDALACFEEADYYPGIIQCCLSLGIKERDKVAIARGIHLAHTTGDKDMLRKMKMIYRSFGRSYCGSNYKVSNQTCYADPIPKISDRFRMLRRSRRAFYRKHARQLK